MFDSTDYPAPLEEAQFEAWLEEGRCQKIGYNYLMIIWDALAVKYLPVYAEDRSLFSEYEPYASSTSQESLVAVYDLYSESRITLLN